MKLQSKIRKLFSEHKGRNEYEVCTLISPERVEFHGNF